MKQETLDMLLEILKKLGCSEETMNAVKNDPVLKVEGEEPETDDEKPEMEEGEDPKAGVAVVVAKKEEAPTEESPMKQLMKSMLKSKWV